jgi:hypothetical protein
MIFSPNNFIHGSAATAHIKAEAFRRRCYCLRAHTSRAAWPPAVRRLLAIPLSHFTNLLRLNLFRASATRAAARPTKAAFDWCSGGRPTMHTGLPTPLSTTASIPKPFCTMRRSHHCATDMVFVRICIVLGGRWRSTFAALREPQSKTPHGLYDPLRSLSGMYFGEQRQYKSHRST